jgi:choline dehydrogenase-like flavoprotein
VLHQTEEAPHPDNRITLGHGRDAYGQRKIAITATWHPEDQTRTMRAQRAFAGALGRLGWGDYRIADQGGAPVLWSRSSSHFMGTTRMNASDRLGVVDASGAVHGTPNVFVASSSIFPRGGFGNVTLTALAMALRTADAMVAARQALIG